MFSFCFLSDEGFPVNLGLKGCKFKMAYINFSSLIDDTINFKSSNKFSS